MGGAAHLISSVTHALTDPITTAVKDLSSGNASHLFSDEFHVLKKDAKDTANATAEVVTKQAKLIIDSNAKVFQAVSKINVKITAEAGKLVGNNALGHKLTWLANNMQQTDGQLVGMSEDIANTQARLAEEGKFFDPKSQAASLKEVNNNWIKDRVVYDANGKPHVIQGLGSKAGTALSIASVFLPVLAPLAVAVNAAAAADNGNWKGVALAAVSAVAPEVTGAFQDAIGVAANSVEGAVAGAVAKGVLQGGANAAIGGSFSKGFESGALSSLEGAAAQAATSSVMSDLKASDSYNQLPSSVQAALQTAVKTAISQGVSGKKFDLNQIVAQSLASAAGDAASQNLGLNAQTAKTLSGAVAQAIQNGGHVNYAALVQKLGVGVVGPALTQMLQTGTEAAANGAPANSSANLQAMLNASWALLPPGEIQTTPAASATVGSLSQLALRYLGRAKA